MNCRQSVKKSAAVIFSALLSLQISASEAINPDSKYPTQKFSSEQNEESESALKWIALAVAAGTLVYLYYASTHITKNTIKNSFDPVLEISRPHARLARRQDAVVDLPSWWKNAQGNLKDYT